ncbi:hypothetical protein BST81_10290 [Leptolyngbya sp. 'hensonii']|nr:hypothetical protein BST81_10290 [Leptolyngbya sp. 'hensonii']
MLLVGCTPEGEVISETTCNAATAEAIYTWRVQYYTNPSRNNPNDYRWVEFSTTRLTNRNGEKPAAAVTGPDDNGVWWPALPARPLVDEVDDRRKFSERNDAPELLRTVNYRLDCAIGPLTTDPLTYRQTAKAFRGNQTVKASYSLGRVLNVSFSQ